MLEYYHLGAYGQVHHHKWSCCNAVDRTTQGCQRTTTQLSESKTRDQLLSVDSHSSSSSKVIHRRHTALRHHPSNQRSGGATLSLMIPGASDCPDSSFISPPLATKFSSSLSELDHAVEIMENLMNEDLQSDNTE